MKVDLIIENAVQLVTCASDGKPKRGATLQDVGIIENGSLAISAGKIVAVGTSVEMRQDFQAENTIDASGKIVVPGFFDCHTHAGFSGSRLDQFELKIKDADYFVMLEKDGGIM